MTWARAWHGFLPSGGGQPLGSAQEVAAQF